ncbi:unnamed protein product [Symbiodinium microadriaticum]|nr:unnamed protein product [Symbiodinium microadriaticum]CAE7913137.1 unnamed protein product [Symbiodinium sp. KB8]
MPRSSRFVGVEIDEQECDDVLQSSSDKKLVYSQKGVCLGFVKRGSTLTGDGAHLNLIDWRSATNRRVVESSFAAETCGALMGHNMVRFAQVLISEILYGSEVISAIEDDGWQDLCPVTLITDCKRIYDTVHKDGQHVSEKCARRASATTFVYHRERSDELHMVDSRSLSAWKGSSFTDLFDFNLALRDGRATFHRKLSLLLRDVEMTKAVVRQAKEREKEQRASKVKKEHQAINVLPRKLNRTM